MSANTRIEGYLNASDADFEQLWVDLSDIAYILKDDRFGGSFVVFSYPTFNTGYFVKMQPEEIIAMAEDCKQ